MLAHFLHIFFIQCNIVVFWTCEMCSVFNGVKKRKITFKNKDKIYSTTDRIIPISMRVRFYYRNKIIWFIYKHNARCFAQVYRSHGNLRN